MTTDRNALPPTGNPPDNLETITGIGPKTAEALAHIGVQRFADLAQATPAALAQALFEQVGLRVSPERIAAMNWIGQAQALLEQAGDAAQVASPQNSAAVELPGALLSMEKHTDRIHWQQHAGFSLFFDYGVDDQGNQSWQTRVWQSRIYHDESGVEVLFPGVDPQPWVHWILEQAGLSSTAMFPQATTVLFDLVAEAQSAMAAHVTPVALPGPTRIEITEAQVSESGPSIGVPEKQIQVQVHFKLVGAEAEKLVSDNLPCRLEVHTVDIERGLSVMVASERVELQSQRFDYVNRQHFSLPPVGRYRLYCLLLVLPPGNLVAYEEGPIIHVIP